MKSRFLAVLGFALASAISQGVQPPLAVAYCTGDCDRNGTVVSGDLGEWVNCRGIAFGSRPLSVCTACDCNEDGVVSDAEWMQAQQNAGGSCSASECPAATVTPVNTPTRTATNTSAIPTRTRTPTVGPATATPIVTPTSSATATAIPGTCVGDCDNSGGVVVNELVIGVNITLERAAVSACQSFDANNSATVSIDELVRGVNNLLGSCSAGTDE